MVAARAPTVLPVLRLVKKISVRECFPLRGAMASK
jgi:hypothetical protein